MLHARLAWLRVRPVWLHTSFLHLHFLSRAAWAPSEAACTLGLAPCTPCTATHSTLLLHFGGRAARAPSEAACTLSLASRTPCMATHSTLHLHLLSRAACAPSHRLRLHACLAWLLVRPVWLHAPVLHLRFLSRAACAPSEAACALGLASCTCTLYGYAFSSPAAFSEPSCMYADWGCVHVWFGFVWAVYG